MSIYLAITVWAIFIGYALAIAEEYGVLTSVSASTYVIPYKGIFTLVLWTMGILNIFIEIDWWHILASIGIFYSGVTVLHAKALAGKIHYIGTVLAIVFNFIGYGFGHGFWLPTFTMAIGALVIWCLFEIHDEDSWIWWVEIYAITLKLITDLWIYV